MRYTIDFTGRTKGADGISYRIIAEREAPNAEAAILALYDAYEHIHLPRPRLTGEGKVRRFAISHVAEAGTMAGVRTLSLTNQGRFHFDRLPDAERALLNFSKPHGLPRVLTPGEVETLAVAEVSCWDHGDACGVYPDDVVTTLADLRARGGV